MTLREGLVGFWTDDGDTDRNMLRYSSGNENPGSQEGTLETGQDEVLREAYGFDGGKSGARDPGNDTGSHQV